MRRIAQTVRASFFTAREVVTHPKLLRIQISYATTELASWLTIIALSVVSFGDAGLTGVGVVFGLRLIPPAVAAPFLGTLADRLPRRQVMVVSDLVRSAFVAGSGAVLAVDGPLLAVYVLLAVVSVAGTASRPAQAALVPSLVRSPEAVAAFNAFSSASEGVMGFFGPILGGLLVAGTSVEVALIGAAGIYFASALMLLGIGEPSRETDVTPSASEVLGDLGDGFSVLVSNRRVSLLVGLIGAQVVVAGVLFVLTNALAFETLDIGERGLGALLSAMGIGSVVGSVAALGLAGSGLARVLAAGVVLWGAPIAALAFWQTPVAAFVLIGVVGFANSLVDIAGFTLLQRSVQNDLLARVFGILESVMYSAGVAGALAAPALVHVFDLNVAFLVTGLSLPVLVGVTWPLIRALDERVPSLAERLESLRAVPFLATLPPSVQEHLAGVFRSVSVDSGEDVLRQGDEGREFFIVREGEVSVLADDVLIHEDGPRYYFGEVALLRDQARMATVRATTSLKLFALDRDEFLGAVTGHLASRQAAAAVVAARLGAYRPAPLSL